MSFTMDGQSTLADIVDSVRLHVNTIVYWSDGRLFCRCLMDTENSYQETIEIDRSQVVGEPEFTRPLWTSTINELRCEFVNRQNRYQPETVLVQDLGNMEISGLINSKKMGLRGFTNRQTAQRQANRILRELSYPTASLRLVINRINSRLIPGDFVKFVWSEWSAGTVISYWRVASFSDENQDDRGIELVLMEDQFKPAVEAETDDEDIPIDAWSDTDAVGDEAGKHEDSFLPFDAGDISPVMVRDLNIYMARYERRYAVVAQRRSGVALSMEVYLGEEGSAEWEDRGDVPCWGILGETTSSLPALAEEGFAIDRTVTLTGTLENDSDLTDLLEAASIVTVDGDDFDQLTKKSQCILIIGNECIQVGYATEAAGVITFRNFIRGVFGTTKEEHPSGSQFAFIPLFTLSNYSQKYTSAHSGYALDWKGIGVTPSGLDLDSETTFELPTASHKLKDLGVKPFPPEFLELELDGSEWKIHIRPRFHHKGAGIGSINEWIEQTTDELDGYSFPIQPNTLDNPVLPTSTNLHESNGKVTLRYPAAGVTSFKIYSSFAGKRSDTFAET